jgi:hypothetical protein
VQYLRYWVNQPRSKTLCLVDALSADAPRTAHCRAHGPVADEIYPVQEGA